MKEYDYLVVGAGLFGAVFACEMTKKGKKCLVIDKREHLGGNIYCKELEGIQVHQYGPHIFHTNDKYIWDYVNDLVEFNRFTNSPLAIYKDKLFNLPFNMNTFHQMWGVKDPQEAQNIINAQKKKYGDKVPENLEEQAISLVGEDLYQALIKGYTEKQWGRSAKELPAFIIKRIPVRFTFDNNYFSDRYQGIPVGGYTKLIEKMLEGVDVKLGIDFLKDKDSLASKAHRIIYTGPIDQYFDYRFGALEYRSLKFETERHEFPNFQGNAVINFTDANVPYTRIIEHKHFEYGTQDKTVITREYPADWKRGDEPYYPINDAKNNAIYEQYLAEAEKNGRVIFCGRLADYKYYDMHVTVERALDVVEEELGSI